MGVGGALLRQLCVLCCALSLMPAVRTTNAQHEANAAWQTTLRAEFERLRTGAYR